MLQQFIETAKKYNVPAYAVTVIRDGVSETARINPASDCNDIYSISKNFTATAIGMLCDRGMLSVDDTIYSVLSVNCKGSFYLGLHYRFGWRFDTAQN